MQDMSSPRHAPIEFSTPLFDAIDCQRNRYRTAQLAPATTLSYDRDWRVFEAWCRAAKRSALPASPDTVELYTTDLIGRGRKVTTLARHVAGIQYRTAAPAMRAHAALVYARYWPARAASCARCPTRRKLCAPPTWRAWSP